jgi:hypothetical protein
MPERDQFRFHKKESPDHRLLPTASLDVAIRRVKAGSASLKPH